MNQTCTCGGGIGIISFDGPDEFFNRFRSMSRMFRTMVRLEVQDDTGPNNPVT